MITGAQYRAVLQQLNPEALLLADLDDAIAGLAERAGYPTLAVYDYEALLRILIARDGMSHQEALEHVEGELLGALAGPHAPLILRRYFDLDSQKEHHCLSADTDAEHCSARTDTEPAPPIGMHEG